ncbi:unnamed protein product [Adineta steineri]|uniref:SLED domain-containing protein n=2 Tax=Adineta steineri TaxID=433720 RepID=A0A814T263_9BILA|nr:unnamed protein product [Adineta steineri]
MDAFKRSRDKLRSLPRRLASTIRSISSEYLNNPNHLLNTPTLPRRRNGISFDSYNDLRKIILNAPLPTTVLQHTPTKEFSLNGNDLPIASSSYYILTSINQCSTLILFNKDNELKRIDLSHSLIYFYDLCWSIKLNMFLMAGYSLYTFDPRSCKVSTIEKIELARGDWIVSITTNNNSIYLLYSCSNRIECLYLLTIYVNIRCFSGPHICSSRLARLPSKFGPGPYRHVLIDMLHHLLSILSTNAHRALRRLDHQINSKLKTENIKSAKKSSKLIRPISIPIEPCSVYHYLRHICTQLEACPNLLSIKHIDNHCPDKCHILSNTFTFSTHSKHKRTQLRVAQNRYRKQKSLLCHLKSKTISTSVPSPTIEQLPLTEIANTNDVLPITTVPVSYPGSDRQTRGFRFHIERKTHKITRTNKKPEVINNEQEPIETNHLISEASSSSSSTHAPIKESKRLRVSKKKRPLSSPLTLDVLNSYDNSPSSPNNTKKKRRLYTKSQTPKVEIQQPSSIRSIPYPIPPPIDPRNPITWNVNDVCWYLNESGCSFALKTIKEQEIDGSALLLLDDLNTVQDLLEFKLGPAVKFCHVVEQLRNQVLDTFHSSPSLKTSSSSSSRLSTN